MSCPTPLLRDPAAFESALAAVPGWGRAAGHDRVEPLGEAGANASFKVTTAEGIWVLRIGHDPDRARLLGVDVARERALQACAASAGIAPLPDAIDVEGRWQLRAWIDGRAWTVRDFDSAAARDRIAQLMRELHRLPPPRSAGAPLDPLALVQRWVAVLGAAAPRDAVDTVRAALASVDSSRRPAVIIHSDVHPGNVIDTGQRLWLIDWEYAQLGDPLCDLASMLASMPGLAQHAGEMIAALGLAGRVAPGELEAWVEVYRRINSLWQTLAWES